VLLFSGGNKPSVPRVKVAGDKGKALEPATKMVQIATDPPQITRISTDLVGKIGTRARRLPLGKC
jgi:hypothetical protein